MSGADSVGAQAPPAPTPQPYAQPQQGGYGQQYAAPVAPQQPPQAPAYATYGSYGQQQQQQQPPPTQPPAVQPPVRHLVPSAAQVCATGYHNGNQNCITHGSCAYAAGLHCLNGLHSCTPSIRQFEDGAACLDKLQLPRVKQLSSTTHLACRRPGSHHSSREPAGSPRGLQQLPRPQRSRPCPDPRRLEHLRGPCHDQRPSCPGLQLHQQWLPHPH